MDLLTSASWMTLGAAGGGGLFPELTHVLWALINFAIILWVLNRFIFKPLLKTLDAREGEIKKNLDQAAADRAEAEKLRREFTEQVAGAQRQAQEIVSQATRNAQAEAERIIAEAREKAAAEWERAQKQIQVERDRAIAELREEVAVLAVSVAGKVIGRSLNDDDHTRLAKKFVEEVGKH